MMYYLKTDWKERTVIPEHQISRIISKDITKDGDKFKQAKHIIETVDGKRFCCAQYYTRKIIEVPLGRYLFVEKHDIQNDENDDIHEFLVHNVLALEYELASDSMDYEAINGTIINYFVDEVASYASIRSLDCGYLIDIHCKRIMEYDTIAPLTKEFLLLQLGYDANDYYFDSQLSLEQILCNFSIKIYKKVQEKGEKAN